MTSCISLGSKKEPPIHWFTFEVMVSAKDNCKRALVTLLKTFATLYGCSVELTRNSTDTDVPKAYRAVSRNVHPDRGGQHRRPEATQRDLRRLVQRELSQAQTKRQDQERGVRCGGGGCASGGLGENFLVFLSSSSSFSFFLLLSPSFFLFLLHCLGLGSGL